MLECSLSMSNPLLMICWRYPDLQQRKTYLHDKQILHYCWRFFKPCQLISLIKYPGASKLHPYFTSNLINYANIKQLLSRSIRPRSIHSRCILCNAKYCHINASLACYSSHFDFIFRFSNQWKPFVPFLQLNVMKPKANIPPHTLLEIRMSLMHPLHHYTRNSHLSQK